MLWDRSVYHYSNILRRKSINDVNISLQKRTPFLRTPPTGCLKNVFSTSVSEISENVCFYFMIGFPWRLYSDKIFLCCGNTKYLELIKRRSKLEKNNMSCERTLNYDQWKPFSANCKPMRIWLWLVYKFADNYCRSSRLFSEFIQIQKRYPTSPDKIRMLTWKLLVISS